MAQASTANFQDILNKKVGEVEKPKPIPIGSYLFAVAAPPKIGPLGKKQTLAAEFTCKVIAPRPDVDQNQINNYESGGVKGLDAIRGKEMRLTHWLTEDALYRTKEFCVEHLGLDEQGGQKSIGQLVNECMNRTFVGFVVHNPSEDGTTLYANIQRTAKAD